MRARPALALGALLFVGCVFVYPTLLRSFTRRPFEVHLSAGDVSKSGKLEFETNNIDAPLLVDGEPFSASTQQGSGLHNLRWLKRFGGGHQRSVGHTQLVGPMQDPKRPPCSTHLLVGQAFLDDGKASEGTMAHVVRSLIERELVGFALWPLGRFKGIEALHLRWSRLQDSTVLHGLRTLMDQAPDTDTLSGYLHISVDLHFDKGDVPLRLSLIPRITDATLQFKLLVHAKLELDNRFYQMVVNLFDGNDRVSRIVDHELSDGLRYVLDTPPSIPLGNGSQLDLVFCEGSQLIFHDRGFVAVPLAIKLDDRAPAPPLEDIVSGPVNVDLQAPLAVDIDRNGLNAIAHKLWSSGLLDQEVAMPLVRDFNAQESVRDYLSLRIESAFFHLPPTIELLEGGVRLRAAMRAELSEGKSLTRANLFTQISWPFGSWQPGSELAIHLDELQMTCSTGQQILQACYAEILEQVRANQELLQTGLGQAFSGVLTELLIRREIGNDSVPASFELDHTIFVRHDAVLRAELFGQLSKIKEQ